MLVVDYLNFKVLWKVLSARNKYDQIIYLFRNRSMLEERICLFCIKSKGIGCEFRELQFKNGKHNIWGAVNDRVDRVVKTLVNKKELNFSGNLRFYDYELKKYVFYKLWRTVSILDYVNTYYPGADKVYVQMHFDKNIFNVLYDALCKEYGCLEFWLYSASSKIDDDGYAYRLNYSYKTLGSGLLYLGFNFLLLFVAPLSLSNNKKFRYLVITHPPDVRWLSLSNVYKGLDGKAVNVGINELSGFFPRFLAIKPSEYWLYLKHVIDGSRKLNILKCVSTELYILMLMYWRRSFLIDQQRQRSRIKCLFTSYESDIIQLAQSVYANSSGSYAFSTVWSLGFFPTEHSIVQHKFSDRVFVWGKWHIDLFQASRDESKGYVEIGYPGADHFSDMRKQGENRYGNNEDVYIITVIDNLTLPDFAYSEALKSDVSDVLNRIAEDDNICVILKTKRQRWGLGSGVNVLYDDEPGSLISSFYSDVVIGLGVSSLSIVAHRYGINTMLYYPETLTPSGTSYFTDKLAIVQSKEELLIRLRKQMSDAVRESSKNIEYLINNDSGNVQDKISMYLNMVVNNTAAGCDKSEVLKDVDSKFNSYVVEKCA